MTSQKSHQEIKSKSQEGGTNRRLIVLHAHFFGNLKLMYYKFSDSVQIKSVVLLQDHFCFERYEETRSPILRL